MIKQRTQIKYIAVIALLAICMLLPQIPFKNIKSGMAEDAPSVFLNGSEAEWNGGEYDYNQGDIFTLPSNVKISYGGQEYGATVILRDPTLNGFNSAAVELKAAGKYVLEYRAKAGTKPLSAKQYFYCNNPLFSASNPRTKASYQADPMGYGKNSGVFAEVAKETTFFYNRPIDLSDAVKEDSFLNFYVAPRDLYTPDVEQITVVLTDMFDSSNYVTFHFKRTILTNTPDMDRYTYITANAVGQPPMGLEFHGTYGDFTWNGLTNLRRHKDNIYGTKVKVSMTGGHINDIDRATNYLGDEFRLSYDAANKAFYALNSEKNPITSSTNRTDPVAGEPLIIADLDDRSLFDDLWPGFTTDQVLMSVSCTKYVQLSAGIVFTNIAGHDLTATGFKDGDEPIISVDFGDYNVDSIPEAKAGTQYPIFPATSYDGIDGAVITDASVWYNYYMPSKARITLQDGKFTPPYPGTYTIVYSAKDKSGNVAERLVSVNAPADFELLGVNLANDAGVSPRAGAFYKVKTPTVIGGSGNKTFTISAFLKSNPAEKYTVSNETGEYGFVPVSQGEYTVEYLAGDYLGVMTQSYDFTAGAATGAYIGNEADMPAYFINGAKHKLPALYGYTYTGGAAVYTKCSVTAAQDGGAATAVGADDTFTVAADTSVTVVYTLEMSGGSSAQKTYTVTAVSGTGIGTELDKKGYFRNITPISDPGDSAVKTFDIASYAGNSGGGVSLMVTPAGGVSAFGAARFINPVLSPAFSLDFALKGTSASKIHIYLTDSEDSSVTIKSTYTIGSTVGFRVNNGYNFATQRVETDTFTLAYSAGRIIEKAAGQNIRVTEDLNSKPFTDFKSGSVYVTIEVEGVSGTIAGGVILYKLNNQPLNSDISYVGPEITTYEGGGYQYINTNITLPAAAARDAFDPYTTLTMEVKGPDGNVVTDTAGVLLNAGANPGVSHTFVLSKYGSYTVKYTALNQTDGRSNEYSFNFTVKDLIGPDIQVTKTTEDAAKDSTVSTRLPVFSDDNSAADKLTVAVYMQSPDGKVTRLGTYKGNAPEAFTFKAAATGTYKVLYYAGDESGNVTITSYAVNVK